jgi:ABC-2 type transport system ATP-binding protein
MDPSLAPAAADWPPAPAAGADWPPAPAAGADRPPAPGLGPGQGFAEASAVLGDAAPERICAELVQAGIGVRGFAVTSPSLEDLFVGLTGEGFDV